MLTTIPMQGLAAPARLHESRERLKIAVARAEAAAKILASLTDDQRARRLRRAVP